ncbi:hypothetical protein [Sphingopyxis terrae]|nr:hypothetical protein [Sphingopyxis terrae]
MAIGKNIAAHDEGGRHLRQFPFATRDAFFFATTVFDPLSRAFRATAHV